MIRNFQRQQWPRAIGVSCFAILVISSPALVRAQTCGVVWNLGDILYNMSVHPDGVELWGATYGNGMVMASGGYGDVFTTSNGINWTKRPSGYTTGGDCIFDVAYGNGVFVGSMKDSRILRSTNNGTSWSKVYDSGEGADFYYATYGNGAFVVSGEFNSHLRSTDGGITWTKYSIGAAINGLAFGGGKFWGGGMTAVRKSTDGASWSVAYSTDHRIGAVAAGDYGVVAAGHQRIDDISHPKIYFSSDGINWTLRADMYTQAGLAREVQFAGYGAGVYVVGGGSGFLVTSTDGGITWNAQNSGHGHYLFDMAYHEDVGRMVVVGNTSDRTPATKYQYAARYSDCGSPVITQHPASVAVCQGGSAQFCIRVIGDPPLAYQWQRYTDGSWQNVTGAQSSCYTINPVNTSHAGYYRCVVSNTFGSATSNTATLTVRVPPTVSGHPQSQVVCEFGTVQFSVTLSQGSSPLNYQWERNTGSGWQNAPNGTWSTYTINSAALSDAGQYRCRVSNDCGSATSNAATLTVTARPRADFDCDQDVDQEDFGHFQMCLSGSDVIQTDSACQDADLDDDDDVDAIDFVRFANCMSGANIPADLACAD